MRVLIAAAVAALCVLPAAAEVVDAVVATVDTEVILQSDLMNEAGPMLSDAQASAGLTTDQILRRALESAIEQRILYRQALLLGLQLPDSTVEERVAKIRASFDSNEEFERMLGETGMTLPEFRDMVRKQILAISMGSRKRSEFAQAVVISEGDIRQFYQDNKSQFALPERVLLRRIFLGAGNNPAERAKAVARLEALRDEIASGATFADLAKQHSEGPDAAEGGLVGWVARGDLVPVLEEAAFALQPGELSPVVETEFGFQILLAEERQDAGTADFDALRTQIEPVLRNQLAAEKYDKWMSEIKKRSRVRVFL